MPPKKISVSLKSSPKPSPNRISIVKKSPTKNSGGSEELFSVSEKPVGSVLPKPGLTNPPAPNLFNRQSLLATKPSPFSRKTGDHHNRDNLPWIEKFRPQDLSEVISHDEKVKTLRRLIEKGQLPHLLMWGSPGSGKTSCILALAREMYGPNFRKYILELNASDDRGIDIVRNKIPIFAKTKSDQMRLVILDEADAMTHDAQSALRRVMELFINNCRFCLICNNINKIIDGIKSRCAPMRFGMLDRQAIKGKLVSIIALEQIQITDPAIDTLLEINQDFRQILNTLQCMNSIREPDQPIDKKLVVEYLGKPDSVMMVQIIDVLNTKSFKEIHRFLLELHRQNRINLAELVKDLSYWVIEADLPKTTRSQLLDGLANVEYRIIVGSDTELQLASLVGIWVGNRSTV